MDRALVMALLMHRRGLPTPSSPWGMKNPRIMFFLPHLHRHFPDLKFIHLVRDGRDMAFSGNRFQLNTLGDLFSSTLRTRLAGAPPPVRAVALWSEANGMVARWGEATLGPRYLRVRFEDLCTDPVAAVRRICDFLETHSADARAFLPLIQAPDSIGRWRGQAPDLLKAIVVEGQAGLRAFGYVSD